MSYIGKYIIHSLGGKINNLTFSSSSTLAGISSTMLSDCWLGSAVLAGLTRGCFLGVLVVCLLRSMVVKGLPCGLSFGVAAASEPVDQ